MSTRIEIERARIQKTLDEVRPHCEALDEIFGSDHLVKEHARLQRMLNLQRMLDQATIPISK